MAVITPNSDVILLKVPLEIDENNQLTFANATAQYNYFYGLTGKKAFDKFTYQRKDGTIRVPALIDDLYEYNYVMYRNTNHSNKWFYAYITDMSYVSDQVTAITIKNDPWQCWQFDLTYKPTFVEREHVNDDTIGLHTLPENLELGEYVVNNVTNVLDSTGSTFHGGTTNSLFIIMGVTQAPSGDNVSAGLPSSRMYDGLFQGLYFLAFDSVADVENVIKMYDTAGQASAIYCIFTAPRSLVGASTWTVPHTWSYTKGSTTITATIYHINTSQGGFANTLMTNVVASPNYRSVEYGTANEHRVYNLDGYEFKNNKMLSYPFSFLYVTNNGGGDCIYKYEDFKLGTIIESGAKIINARLNVYGSLSASAQTRLVPCNYKNLLDGNNIVPNYTYGLAGQKFPASSWTSDYYTNWLTQNGVNIATNLIISAASGVATASTGGLGVAFGTIGLGKTIASALGQIHTAQITPDQAKGDLSCGDINYSTGKTGFAIQAMSVRSEVAKIIDDYFSAYGYCVNSIKVPNVTGRTNWNYVKTVGCYILADIPQTDLAEIKSMFDKGITFWHNPTTFMDYSQSNAIVTP